MVDTAEPLIELEDIHFAYPGSAPVLRGISLRLEHGERIGLIGPNGSGKTTLFHVIMGLLKPEKGTIRLLGKPMRSEKDFRGVRQKVGLLFQDPDDQLFSPTVLEDVCFGPLNQGLRPAQARRIAEQTLEALGLQELSGRFTHKLSGGEKRLVSLATVLAMQPRVLLLDEPTTGLDAETTQRLITILHELPIAYIFISHNLDFLFQTTNRLVCMEKGRIAADGETVPHTHVHAHGFGRVPHVHDETRKVAGGQEEPPVTGGNCPTQRRE